MHELKFLSFLKEALLDVFYPKRCIVCNSPLNIGKQVSLCRNCDSELKKYNRVIRNDGKYFEEAVCALEYEGHVKDAMKDFKFHGIRYLGKSFSHALYTAVKGRDFLKEVSFICPVPLHPLRERGYNQSLVIAEEFSRKSGIRLVPDALIKIKNITPLSKMNYSMRQKSIKSAFAVNFQYNISGQTVCLVDDIYTTGATTNECARILRMNGAEKVYVLCACHVKDKVRGGNQNADANNINN